MSHEDPRLGLRLGPVSLGVRDLEAMIEFYVEDMGLKMKKRGDRVIELYPNEDSPEPLVLLAHNSEGTAPPRDAAGLYHFAILMPSRKKLAEAYLSIGKSGIVFDGYADHLVSEALYLTDPEGNGIEVYCDRERNEWKLDGDGRIQMATLPLDIDSLLKETSGTPGANIEAFSDGARIGHVHLKVTNLQRSVAFYQQLLEMNVMSYLESAAFLSVGGYHHHIGMNTWESHSGQPVDKKWSGLEHVTMTISQDFYQRLSARFSSSAVPYGQHSDPEKWFAADPDGIELEIKPAT